MEGNIKNQDDELASVLVKEPRWLISEQTTQTGAQFMPNTQLNDQHNHHHNHHNQHHANQEKASLGILQTSSVQQEQTATSGSLFSSDMIYQYVNMNLVRKMIPQNAIEFLLICVIVIYLIYYFSQISRLPKLIGNNRSKFVQFIRQNLDDTLNRRFSPLIYFWGTNPQTALFGYLQGQTSIDEMPRNKFRRQYLYVSDAQYLTSNVDLSQHYTMNSSVCNNNIQADCPPDGLTGSPRKTSYPLVQLQVAGDLAQQKHLVGSSLLDHNIRLALQDMLRSNKDSHQGERKSGEVEKKYDEPICNGSDGAEDERLKRLKEVDLSSSGSSSDSGVFPGHSSSTTSSTASLSDVTELDKCCDKCTCKTRYDDTISSHLDGPPKPMLSVERDAQQLNSPDVNSSTREQLQYGQCALDWHIDSHKHYHKNKLVALISAGMTTGSDKKYVTDTVSTLEKLGYEVCVFIRRGVGGLKLSSVKFFSPAKWRDFEAAVLSVRQQRPGAHLVAVGFSFGSIELCRYLSMSGKQSLVDAALLISCPFDPEAGGRNMRKRALNRRIDAYLARQLGKQLYQAMFASPVTSGTMATAPVGQDRKSSICVNMNGSSVNLASLPKIKSLVDFEDNYNRILQNYPNSDAYAADSRLQDRLGFIETPTLCLSSEDDFMAPLKLLPLEQIRANKNLCMLLTKRGGHMAFIDGILWPKKPYFAQRIIGNYMKAVRASFSTSDNHHSQDRAKATAKQIEIAKQSHLIQMFDVK